MVCSGNIHNIPLSVEASYPQGHFDDPIRRTWFTPFAIVFHVIATIAIITRLWARIQREAGRFGFDDVLIIVAWLLGATFTVLGILAVQHYYFDRHVWDVYFQHFVGTALVGWLSEGIFLLSTCLTKISVLLFYRRLVEGSYNKIWSWATWIGIVLTLIYCLCFLLILIFLCTPVEAYWKSFDTTWLSRNGSYHCHNEHVSNPLAGALSVVSDAYALLIPTLLIRTLRLPTRQKAELYVTFSLGLLVVGAGIARTYWFTMMANSKIPDATWYGYDVFVWSQLECQLAIMCACAPCLRKYLAANFWGDACARVYASARGVSRTILSNTGGERRERGASEASNAMRERDGWVWTTTEDERIPRQSYRKARVLVYDRCRLGLSNSNSSQLPQPRLVVRHEDDPR